MITGICFEGDNLHYQDIQHDLYQQLVGSIFHQAAERYLSALKVVDIETELGNKVREQRSIDHRTLQYMHDVIATRFRFMGKERFVQCTLSCVLVDMTDGVFERLWRLYLDEFIERLFDRRPIFVSKVLIAAAYPNPDKRGIEAEEFIFHHMKPFSVDRCFETEEWEEALIMI